MAGDAPNPALSSASRLRPCAGVVRLAGGQLLVAVRVSPRAGRDSISCEGESLRVRLRAAPVEGAANEALLALVAERLRVPRRSVTLARGATSREKLVAIAGLTTEEFWRRLDL